MKESNYINNKELVKVYKSKGFKRKESMDDFSFVPEDNTFWLNKKMLYVRLKRGVIAHYYDNMANITYKLKSVVNTREEIFNYVNKCIDGECSDDVLNQILS